MSDTETKKPDCACATDDPRECARMRDSRTQEGDYGRLCECPCHDEFEYEDEI